MMFIPVLLSFFTVGALASQVKPECTNGLSVNWCQEVYRDTMYRTGKELSISAGEEGDFENVDKAVCRREIWDGAFYDGIQEMVDRE